MTWLIRLRRKSWMNYTPTAFMMKVEINMGFWTVKLLLQKLLLLEILLLVTLLNSGNMDIGSQWAVSYLNCLPKRKKGRHGSYIRVTALCLLKNWLEISTSQPDPISERRGQKLGCWNRSSLPGQVEYVCFHLRTAPFLFYVLVF